MLVMGSVWGEGERFTKVLYADRGCSIRLGVIWSLNGTGRRQ